jgi:hypothetical protein
MIGFCMSILKLLQENLAFEAEDFDLADEAEDTEDTADVEDAPTDDDTEAEGDTENAKALVDSLLKYAPGQEQQIKNMLKYAANSDPEYNIFDSAFDYFESLSDKPKVDTDKQDIPTDDAQEEPVRDDSENNSENSENEFDLTK